MIFGTTERRSQRMLSLCWQKQVLPGGVAHGDRALCRLLLYSFVIKPKPGLE